MSTLIALFSTPVLQVLVPLSEAGGEESGLAMAIGIGVAVLAGMLAMLFALLAFGKGRDHS